MLLRAGWFSSLKLPPGPMSSGSRGGRAFLNVEIWLWEGAQHTCPSGGLAAQVGSAETLGGGLR